MIGAPPVFVGDAQLTRTVPFRFGSDVMDSTRPGLPLNTRLSMTVLGRVAVRHGPQPPAVRARTVNVWAMPGSRPTMAHPSEMGPVSGMS